MFFESVNEKKKKLKCIENFLFDVLDEIWENFYIELWYL